jgi:hypothetical protein
VPPIVIFSWIWSTSSVPIYSYVRSPFNNNIVINCRIKGWDIYARWSGEVPITVAHRLRHELSSLTWTLGRRVRVPLKALISVCVYFVFLSFCVYVSAFQRDDLLSNKSYSLWRKRLRNWRRGQGPTKSCTITDEWKWSGKFEEGEYWRRKIPCLHSVCSAMWARYHFKWLTF